MKKDKPDFFESLRASIDNNSELAKVIGTAVDTKIVSKEEIIEAVKKITDEYEIDTAVQGSWSSGIPMEPPPLPIPEKPPVEFKVDPAISTPSVPNRPPESGPTIGFKPTKYTVEMMKIPGLEGMLLPCPHCGKVEPLKMDVTGNGEDAPMQYSIICSARTDGPGGCGSSSGYFASMALLVTNWNTRHYSVGAPTRGKVSKQRLERYVDKEMQTLAQIAGRSTSHYEIAKSSEKALMKMLEAFNISTVGKLRL